MGWPSVVEGCAEEAAGSFGGVIGLSGTTGCFPLVVPVALGVIGGNEGFSGMEGADFFGGGRRLAVPALNFTGGACLDPFSISSSSSTKTAIQTPICLWLPTRGVNAIHLL